MKKPKLHIYIVSLIVGVLIPLLFNLRLLLHHQDVNIGLLLGGMMYSFMETFSIYYCTSQLAEYLQYRYPWHKNLTKRIVIELFMMSTVATILTIINYEIFAMLFSHLSPAEDGMNLIDNIIVAIVMSLIIGSISEITYVIRQWKIALIEAEQLRRESIESQFSALKNQINPHFLFNSLNTLSSLIQISPEKAIEFVNKFSKIYRYVLDVKDKTLVPLSVELEFVNSYLFLQKIRYGENLSFDLSFKKEEQTCLIPPLTLQILVENAIKHNEISDAYPLKINIYSNEELLIVANTLKLKNAEAFSTGIGLNNLKERYSHFSDMQPVFVKENGRYIAKVPLLRDDEN